MSKLLYLQSIKTIRDSLAPERRDAFDLQFAGREKNPSIALLLSVFFGMAGIDRFYLGQAGLGIGKLVTFGGLFVWAMVDSFLIIGATRRRNIEIASELKMMMS